MKLAVCLSGGMKLCHNSVYSIDLLKRDHEVDVFCHIWTGLVKEQCLTGKYIWEVTNSDVEKTYGRFNPVYMVEDFRTKNPEFLEALKDTRKTNNHIMNRSNTYTGVLSMFYSIYKCNDLRQQTSKDYDFVIRMRCDSKITRPIHFNRLRQDKLYIARVYPKEIGMDDRFAIASPSIYDTYANCYNSVVNMVKYYPHWPEGVLYQHIMCNLKPSEVGIFQGETTINR